MNTLTTTWKADHKTLEDILSIFQLSKDENISDKKSERYYAFQKKLDKRIFNET